MPPARKLTPSYVLHRQSGRARATWTDSVGVRQQKLLLGEFNSQESLAAFATLQLELATSPVAVVTDHRNGVTVAELLLRYLNHVEAYYVDSDGNPGTEVVNIKRSLLPVRELYADRRATEFGPLALKAVRQSMVEKGWCRSLINKRIARVRGCFKWGVAEELVPPSVFEALRTVPGLKAGRCGVRESKPVVPVGDEVVKATLPFLPSHVKVMVTLMWYTGMRPGEVVTMTLDQIDTTNETWVFKPRKHKSKSRGKGRAIPFGPKAMTVLREFLTGRVLQPTDLLFSPRRATEERFAAARTARKSKVPPSQTNRRTANPKRKPAEQYTVGAIGHALTLAAKKAGVEHWHVYQLRHAHGTKVRRAFGLEAAGATLGHAKMSATEVYAERDEGLAVTVAARIG